MHRYHMLFYVDHLINDCWICRLCLFAGLPTIMAPLFYVMYVYVEWMLAVCRFGYVILIHEKIHGLGLGFILRCFNVIDIKLFVIPRPFLLNYKF